jgi:hypothetical protein
MIQDRDREATGPELSGFGIGHIGIGHMRSPLRKGNTLYFAKNVFLVTKHSTQTTYAYRSDSKNASRPDS